MNNNEYIAINSKIQILFLVIPAIFLITSSIFFSISKLLGEIIVIYNIIMILISSILIIISINLFYQPNVAIKIIDEKIFFYKRNFTFFFNINEIKKIKINTNYGSFDTTVYTIDGKRKSFHFLIINSNKKKVEYIKYFKDKGIKVIEVDSSID
ncbi:MAG: hypothetical protein PHT03_08515 [Bacilli bacterium]|nr:hypothetical protein [Bacilli bacterium]